MQQKLKVNDIDKEAFLQASKPVYDDFAKEVAGGKELIDRILELQKK
jgi:TRAP-type C4-dicarboxylate transport system substrate-binding protein